MSAYITNCYVPTAVREIISHTLHYRVTLIINVSHESPPYYVTHESISYFAI